MNQHKFLWEPIQVLTESIIPFGEEDQDETFLDSDIEDRIEDAETEDEFRSAIFGNHMKIDKLQDAWMFESDTPELPMTNIRAILLPSLKKNEWSISIDVFFNDTQICYSAAVQEENEEEAKITAGRMILEWLNGLVVSVGIAVSSFTGEDIDGLQF